MWIKVDHGFPDHDKTIAAGHRLDEAQPFTAGATGKGRVLAVWTKAMAHCNRFETDGFVRDVVARGFTDVDTDPIKVFEAMQDGRAKGLARKVSGGWQIINYHKYQPSKDSLQKQRKKAQKRMERVRKARAKSSRSVRANSSDVRANRPERDRSRSSTRSGPIRTVLKEQDQDPRLSAGPLAVLCGNLAEDPGNSAPEHEIAKPPACGKAEDDAGPSTRLLQALAYTVIKERPDHWLGAGFGDLSSEIKDRMPRLKLSGYHPDTLARALRAAEAQYRRERQERAAS